MPDSAIEERFNQLYALDLIDVPNEFYAENPPFNNPDELESRLQGMEEENLFLIEQCQDQRFFADAEVQKMVMMKGGIGAL